MRIELVKSDLSVSGDIEDKGFDIELMGIVVLIHLESALATE